jgi:hypothetical protein
MGGADDLTVYKKRNAGLNRGDFNPANNASKWNVTLTPSESKRDKSKLLRSVGNTRTHWK